MKKNEKFILLVILLVCLVFLFIISYFFYLDKKGKRVYFTVDPGMKTREISLRLENEKIIPNSFCFLFWAEIFFLEKKIKAGTYQLEYSFSALPILLTLIQGKSASIKVTIPEGLESGQIAAILEEKIFISAGKFLSLVKERQLEGFLFPDTYFFSPHYPEEKVLETMFNQFEREFNSQFLERAEELRLSKKEIVVLASLIEKEAAKDEERPYISAVFHNRLKKRMFLESCATVQYALGEHRRQLSYQDLKVDSPYNTYIHLGLPPEPICNPGLASLKAALYPAQTDDLFFVSQGNGWHYFSRYYNQHLKNKQLRKK